MRREGQRNHGTPISTPNSATDVAAMATWLLITVEPSAKRKKDVVVVVETTPLSPASPRLRAAYVVRMQEGPETSIMKTGNAKGGWQKTFELNARSALRKDRGGGKLT